MPIATAERRTTDDNGELGAPRSSIPIPSKATDAAKVVPPLLCPVGVARHEHHRDYAKKIWDPHRQTHQGMELPAKILRIISGNQKVKL